MNDKQKKAFKSDRITQAVDRFNKELEDLGVCVGYVNYVNDIDAQTVVKTAIYNEKMVEARTFALLKLHEEE